MPKAYKNHQDYSKQKVSSMRKRALANLLITPILLIGLGVLVYFIWQISVRWAIEYDVTRKVFLGAIGFVFIIIEALLAYLTMKFIKWVRKGLPQTKHTTNNVNYRKKEGN